MRSVAETKPGTDVETKCPICQTERITTFLQRDGVPVHQNLVVRDLETALNVPRGRLTLGLCGVCGFVFNRSFESSRLSYGVAYDNTQTWSGTFGAYADSLVQDLLTRHGVRNSRIVEVGCGKGGFLRKLVEAEGSGNTGHGFDPSYVGPLIDRDGRLRFERRYFDVSCGDTEADVVVCRHVIEHAPRPMELLSAVFNAVRKSPGARVFFETPTVEWILQNRVLCDLFYEHCSYFCSASLSTAFELAGFRVQSIDVVFGGQYLWIEATPARCGPISVRPATTRSLGELAFAFAKSERAIRTRWQSLFEELAAKGPVALWGAGAKGVTLANLIDPRRQWFTCVVDVNPGKQGGYLPGTGHAIIGYRELKARGVRSAVVTNPNYLEENWALLRDAGIAVDLVDLMSWSEVARETDD